MVAATMPAGLKVSIKFTPQAKDDYLYFSEESGGAGYDYGTDDLLANDSAVNAARVWGIFGQSETFVQNNIGTLVSNTQPNGDSAFTVGGADGVQVSYDADTGDIVFTFDPADFDYLADGESVDLGAFTYVIRMSNGAFSTAIANIVINGTNDAPVITVEDGDSDSDELDETDSGLTTFGTLTVTDVDASDEVNSSVTGVVLGGDYGALTEADVLAMLTLEPLTPLAADGELNNLKWTFDSGSQAFNFLAAGESLTLTYTITSDDGNGGTDTHDVAITINGTNDAPVISVGAGDDDDAELDETDAGLKASGSLTVTDLDDSDEVTSTVTDVALSGDTGALVKADVLDMLSLDPATPLAADSGDVNNLSWKFDSGSQAFNFLAATESLILTYTITSEDGNGGSDTHDVTVKINGTNDGPVITVEDDDSDAESLTETDAALSKSGTLTVTDADLSDTVTVSVQGATVGGDYTNGWSESDVLAFFSIGTPGPLNADPGDAKNISWSFDSNPEAFDFLQKDEELVLTYTVKATDNIGDSTTHDVTITITGTEDAAVIVDDPGTTNDFKVVEDSDSTAGGKLLVTDADHDQSAFQAVLPADLAGDYGDFTVDETTGTWTYTLRNGDGNVQALTATDHVTDTLTVQSIDGTTHDIVVKIDGADEPSVIVTLPPTYTGTGDPNDNDALGLPASKTTSDGSGGDSTLYGGAGNDVLNGNSGDDTLYGGSGNDSANGNNDDDLIYGGSGNDSLNGSADNDTLIGGYGADTIDGGAGTDTVRYLDLLDTNDTINGFVSGVDKLDLSAIDADTSDGDNDAFGWGGQQAGATVVANSVTWYTDGTNVYLLADANGNLANAEFAVTLNGITSIQQTDFNTL